jgi:hypothetical protein
MPTITDSIDAERTITHQSLQKILHANLRAATRKAWASLGPEKISVARLPVTGKDVFGREEDIAFLDRAWANKDINVVTIVAWAGVWAGVGKSTLVNHWLRRRHSLTSRESDLLTKRADLTCLPVSRDES